MPKYKTHLFAGFLVYIIIFLVFSVLNLATKIPDSYKFLYLGSCLLGSLFPDIDTKSMIQKILYFLLFIALLIAVFMQKWQFCAILGVISLIPIISNHRGITHRIWFIIFIPFVIPMSIYYYNKNLLEPVFIAYLFFVAGAISHIFLDKSISKLFGKAR
ncbi:MAG: hypothetical protein SZ59_C0001G0123 [candidate division TM6 bacterium GW2011_GWF2_28_16]|nr:MAG: hypothetical protein SZ59_C0001G0123 [candidate division TM6 bacterium GW2011_GWF2_28_16]